MAPKAGKTDDAGIQAALFGVPLGAIALISLIQKVLKIGLVPVLSDFMQVWRRLTAPLHDLLSYLASFVHLDLPDWYHDAFVLSFVGCTVFFRAMDENVLAMDEEASSSWRFVVHAILGFIFSIPLFGVLLTYGVFFPGPSVEHRRHAAKVRRELFAIAGIVITFYVANSSL